MSFDARTLAQLYRVNCDRYGYSSLETGDFSETGPSEGGEGEAK